MQAGRAGLESQTSQTITFNFSERAKDLLHTGFSVKCNQSKDYKAFGDAVSELGSDLDDLRDIIKNANHILHQRVGPNCTVTWDEPSRVEIIGNYEKTLDECFELVFTNLSYSNARKPFHGIEWNPLLQDKAQCLKLRIAEHNTRLRSLFEPFEIDILCRTRTLLQNHRRRLSYERRAILAALMPVKAAEGEHQSLDSLADTVRSSDYEDIPLPGIFTGDLDHSLKWLQKPSSIPNRIAKTVQNLEEKFNFADLINYPQGQSHHISNTLPGLCHAFIHNFERATQNVQYRAFRFSGTPAEIQYLDLIGSTWIFQTLQKFSEKELINSDSHWPSYIRQLELIVSKACQRFNHELVPPSDTELTQQAKRRLTSMGSRQSDISRPSTSAAPAYKLVFESPLMPKLGENERIVSLYRRLDQENRAFSLATRFIPSIGTYGLPNSTAEVRDEQCDFETRSAVLRPFFSTDTDQKFVIETAGRSICLSFLNMKHLLKFQQALTGYKAWGLSYENNVLVSFLIAGFKEQLVEKASVQLWIPEELDDYIVNARQLAHDEAVKSRDRVFPRHLLYSDSTQWLGEKQGRRAGQHSTVVFSSSLAVTDCSVDKLSTRVAQSRISDQSPTAISEASSYGRFVTPSCSFDKPTSASTAPWSYENFPNTMFYGLHQGNKLDSSKGLAQCPVEPLLVLFTQSQSDGQRKALVTIPIDEDTAINPERCNCWRQDQDVIDCNITAIERQRGQSRLRFHRYDFASEHGWKIDMQLLESLHEDINRVELKRIDLIFLNAEAKTWFFGNQGHHGSWGEVKEFYRRQLEEYDRHRNETFTQALYEDRSLDQPVETGGTRPFSDHTLSLRISDKLQKYITGDRTFASFEDLMVFPGPFWHTKNKPHGLVDSVEWAWELPALIGSKGENPGSRLGDEVVIALSSNGHYQGSEKYYRPYAFTCDDWIHTCLPLAWRDWFTKFLRKLEASLAESDAGNFRADLLSQDYRRGTWVFNWMYDEQRLYLSIPPTSLNQELLELIEIVGWFCRALRKPRLNRELNLTSPVYRLDTREIERPSSNQMPSKYALRPIILFEDKHLPEGVHDCWKKLFDSCTIAECQRLEKLVLNDRLEKGRKAAENEKPFGKGLGTSFDLLVSLSAVEYAVAVDGGIVFVGYNVMLIPTEVNEAGTAAQFHVVTTVGDDHSSPSSQINPYLKDLGQRLLTKDIRQFRNMRCFLGWCESAHINLGTQHLRAEVSYSGCREKGESLYIDGFEPMIQFGLEGAGPLTAILGLQTNFKYTSHRRQFTSFGGFQKLLLDTAHEVAAIYDSGKQRGWLVPKLSVLLHMAQAYALNYGGKRVNGVPYVSGHIEASNLIDTLERYGDQPVFRDTSGSGEAVEQTEMSSNAEGLVLRQLLLGLNTNLLSAVAAVQKSSGKKLYGFEFMDAVTAPGRVNQVDAVIVCSDIGQVITPAAELTRRNQWCNSLPTGRDYLAAMLPCLRRLARRRGDDAFLSSSSMETIVDPNSRDKDTCKAQSSSLMPAQGMKVTEDSFWYVQGDPFHGCQHDIESNDTCWNREGFLQHLKTQSYLARGLAIVKRESEPKFSSTCAVPVGGAVVFG